jgi:hypothetical protein
VNADMLEKRILPLNTEAIHQSAPFSFSGRSTHSTSWAQRSFRSWIAKFGETRGSFSVTDWGSQTARLPRYKESSV